jgi:hypothetical protein
MFRPRAVRSKRWARIISFSERMLRRCVSSEEGRGLELIRRLNLPRDEEEKVYAGNARDGKVGRVSARGWSAMTVIGTNRISRHVRYFGS